MSQRQSVEDIKIDKVDDTSSGVGSEKFTRYGITLNNNQTNSKTHTVRKEIITLINTRPHTPADSKFGGIQLPHCNLSHLDLRNLPFERANLIGCNLEQTRLDNCCLESANLEWVNLKGANLSNADLKKANLKHADLRNANLQGADLKFVSLQGARLDGTNLRNVNLQFANLGMIVFHNVFLSH
jgi:uncharacterized protein YjbI with pentapeptide repeats